MLGFFIETYIRKPRKLFFDLKNDYFQNVRTPNQDYRFIQSTSSLCRNPSCSKYDRVMKVCSGCKKTFYCSIMCAEQDQNRHQPYCEILKRTLNCKAAVTFEVSCFPVTTSQWKCLEQPITDVLTDLNQPIPPENIFLTLTSVWKFLTKTNAFEESKSVIKHILEKKDDAIEFFRNFLDLGLNPQIVVSFYPIFYWNPKMYDLLHFYGTLTWSSKKIIKYFSSSLTYSKIQLLFLQWLVNQGIMIKPITLPLTFVKNFYKHEQALRWLGYKGYLPFQIYQNISLLIFEVKKNRPKQQYTILNENMILPKDLIFLSLQFLEDDFEDFCI